MADEDTEGRLAALEQRVGQLELDVAESQLETWSARLADLEVQNNLARKDAREQLKPVLAKMSTALADAQRRLDGTKSTVGDAWMTLLGGVRDSLHDVRTGLDQAARKVRSAVPGGGERSDPEGQPPAEG